MDYYIADWLLVRNLPARHDYIAGDVHRSGIRHIHQEKLLPDASSRDARTQIVLAQASQMAVDTVRRVFHNPFAFSE